VNLGEKSPLSKSQYGGYHASLATEATIPVPVAHPGSLMTEIQTKRVCGRSVKPQTADAGTRRGIQKYSFENSFPLSKQAIAHLAKQRRTLVTQDKNREEAVRKKFANDMAKRMALIS